MVSILLVAFPGAAAIYHVNPATGQMSNPGTADKPWSTLQAVIASGRKFASGDVILLHAGHHGRAYLRGEHDGAVTIQAQDGDLATLESLTFRHTRHWRVRGVSVSPSTSPEFRRATMVSIGSDCSDLTIENCLLYTVKDSGGWSAADWNEKACNGIDARGPNITLRGNHLLNVDFGISVSGVSNVVERNVVENFSGDGLRGLGDYGVFQFNTVKNCYDVNDNHDDGFQSWSRTAAGVGRGVVRGLILRGNRIVNYEDPNQPHRGTLQGIGCFDGFFEDWIIENNEILVDHYHGISLYGARGCRIINNTVMDLNSASPGPPWIKITRHKRGAPSSDNVVRNNLAPKFAIDEGAAVSDHNLEIRDGARVFVDLARRDTRLVEGSPAIDAGSPKDAPHVDIVGTLRPLDGNRDGQPAWDVGAREFQPATVGRPGHDR